MSSVILVVVLLGNVETVAVPAAVLSFVVTERLPLQRATSWSREACLAPRQA
ncbi:hypothetical protein ACWGN5_27985 [Streptomyces sp. NPDC055815]